MKQCITCKETLLLEDFSIDRSNKDNRQRQCRICNNQAKRKIHERNRDYQASIKENGECLICGESHISVLVFHHKVPGSKRFNIGNPGTRSIKRIQEEIEKCDLLCANCHRKLHYAEG